MPINVTMPALSPTMEEGNLAKWLVKEGDSVSPGDVIAEIETDKATMEVEAVEEGTVAKILVPAGTEGVKVNAVIAILSSEGESAEAATSNGGSLQSSATTQADKRSGAIAADPKADDAVVGSVADAENPDGRSYSRSAETATNAAPASTGTTQPSREKQPEPRERVFSSPLARRMATEKGIDLASVHGTGPHGRIVKSDVENFKQMPSVSPESRQETTAPPIAAATVPERAAPSAKTSTDDAILKLFAEGTYEKIPHDGMRKTIAKRLVESKQTVPHFYLTLDCELDALLTLRKQLNAAAPMMKGEAGDRPAYKLSVNDMIIKAMAAALRAVPDANVSWTESAMLKHRHADVGVAVSIEGGLITPIIRRADEKTLSTISNEMKDLARRARSRKLKPEEYQGGTTAVSNLGMFGIKDFSAVINPPHATILAVGAGEERAVVKNGAIVVANVMTVTLSTDHRAVDGALGAELLTVFRRFVESPMGMLV